METSSVDALMKEWNDTLETYEDLGERVRPAYALRNLTEVHASIDVMYGRLTQQMREDYDILESYDQDIVSLQNPGIIERLLRKLSKDRVSRVEERLRTLENQKSRYAITTRMYEQKCHDLETAVWRCEHLIEMYKK